MGRTVEALQRTDFTRYSTDRHRHRRVAARCRSTGGARAFELVFICGRPPIELAFFYDHVVGVIHTHYVRYAATERMCPGPLGYLVHPIVGPIQSLCCPTHGAVDDERPLCVSSAS